MTAFLPHLGSTLCEARQGAGLARSRIAAFVEYRGREGVSESTIARFETGRYWPEDPDAIIVVYAEALGCDAFDLWQRAVDVWRQAGG